MKRVYAINGSPRAAGNSKLLLQQFMEGARETGAAVEEDRAADLDLKDCQGCLRCNILRRCSISGDDWATVCERIAEADLLVLATPVYFHHVPASVKRIIDRFRSFIHVQITETGLIHTPWKEWKKDFVLILSLGSPDKTDAEPVIELFRFMTSILGEENRLHILTATRLAMAKQVVRSSQELTELYRKLKIPESLAGEDYSRNARLLEECRQLGTQLSADLR